MATESDNLEQLLTDIARTIAENRRFLDTLLDEASESETDLSEAVEEEDGCEETFEEL